MDFQNQQFLNHSGSGQAGFFKDRVEAGGKLAEFLKNIKGTDAVVYALPRGGVVVGAEIARTIKAPLDLIITRKIGHPMSPEYAIGAVAENGDRVLNEDEAMSIPEEYLNEETQRQRIEAKRRRQVYLGDRQPVSCKGKTAILVDDGIATGLTMKAAIQELIKHYDPLNIIVATPVAPKEAVEELEKQGVEVVSILKTKEFLGAIGAYYQNFTPVEDTEVEKILKEFN